MSFPINRVVLSTLADVDFLAALALTETSATLCKFILDHVVTMSTFSRFLREHQYILHHDKYERLFSFEEIIRLHRAFGALQSRHGVPLYEETFSVLGPLLSRTPFKMLKKSPGLPQDFSMSEPTDISGRSQGSCSLSTLELWYYFRFRSSWLHNPQYLQDGGQCTYVFYCFHNAMSNQYLREDFLFCKRYIDEFNTCRLIFAAAQERTRKKSGNWVVHGITSIRTAFEETALSLLHEKRCLYGFLNVELRPTSLDRQKISSDTFRSLFQVSGWMELWNPSELGGWFAIGLSQYGPDCVASLIEQCFKTKREALFWLFLGAHHWFHETQPRREDPEFPDDVPNCCRNLPYGLEREYVSGLMESISRQDRIWLVEQLVRHASEFGRCRDLCANIFNYFVVRDMAEADLMLSILLKEICTSRLQFLFEYAISVAIADYKMQDNAPALEFEMAKRYNDNLLRRDMNLYCLLSGASDGSNPVEATTEVAED